MTTTDRHFASMVTKRFGSKEKFVLALETKMKPFEDMNLTDQIDLAVGRLAIALGSNKFRDEVANLIVLITATSYNRGKKAGKAEARKKR